MEVEVNLSFVGGITDKTRESQVILGYNLVRFAGLLRGQIDAQLKIRPFSYQRRNLSAQPACVDLFFKSGVERVYG